MPVDAKTKRARFREMHSFGILCAAESVGYRKCAAAGAAWVQGACDDELRVCLEYGARGWGYVAG